MIKKLWLHFALKQRYKISNRAIILPNKIATSSGADPTTSEFTTTTPVISRLDRFIKVDDAIFAF
jgi:hypothetical protein